ncbi:MAG: 4Fe-4S binding protein [Coriobacteriaceae bacterium]|jgi:ferredoxin-type protein NapH|nr:4Fe-4S binding protein [Coriobacteriaceae bacterium]
MKITTARAITLVLVPVLVVLGLVFHTGSGTPSSFGWTFVASVCPLGALEAMLASGLVIPRVLVVLVLALAFGFLFGKVFCAWVCPVPPLRGFFTRRAKGKGKKTMAGGATDTGVQDTGVQDAEVSDAGVQDAGVPDAEVPVQKAHAAELAGQRLQSSPETAAEGSDAAKTPEGLVNAALSVDERTSLKAGCPSGCASCAEKRKKLDSRHIVLGGTLVSAAIFGFPVFCLVCPVGLTFATLIAFWRLVGFNEPSWMLLVFPAIVLLEVLVLRKWCLRWCPLGAVMSLLSIPNRFFKPKVDETKCLLKKGKECSVCKEVCPEGLDPHFSDGMHECTKCGLCKEHCPGLAINMGFSPRKALPSKSAPSPDKAA